MAYVHRLQGPQVPGKGQVWGRGAEGMRSLRLLLSGCSAVAQRPPRRCPSATHPPLSSHPSVAQAPPPPCPQAAPVLAPSTSSPLHRTSSQLSSQLSSQRAVTQSPLGRHLTYTNLHQPTTSRHAAAAHPLLIHHSSITHPPLIRHPSATHPPLIRHSAPTHLAGKVETDRPAGIKRSI